MKEWPGIRIPQEEFERYVRERIPEGKSSSDVKMSDLYLACGCARGDPKALDAFEAYLSEVDGAYARTRPPVTASKMNRWSIESATPMASPGLPLKSFGALIVSLSWPVSTVTKV